MACRKMRSNRRDSRCGYVPANGHSLSSLVDEFIRQHRVASRTELDGYRGNSLKETIEIAALSSRKLDRNNCIICKRNPHQCRIKCKILASGKDELLTMVHELRKATDFVSIYELVNDVSRRICGLGELWTYDVALRIGWYLRIKPDVVYLHRGAMKGAKNMGLQGLRATMRKQSFPVEFSRLEPYEIEDFLCICKDELKRLFL